MDYGNALMWIGLSFLAIAAGAGLLYGNFAKWRKWQSGRSTHPPQLGTPSYDMRRDGQRLSAD